MCQNICTNKYTKFILYNYDVWFSNIFALREI